MANMSASEVLKAELYGLAPVKPDLSLPPKPTTSLTSGTNSALESVPASVSVLEATKMSMDLPTNLDEDPGLVMTNDTAADSNLAEEDMDADGDLDPDLSVSGNDVTTEESPKGTKRKHDVIDDEAGAGLGSDEDDAPASSMTLKVNPDGTVEQEDKVKCVKLRPLLAVTHNFRADFGSLVTKNATIARNSVSN
jgi:5'-3' exoribonuclease 2